MHKYHAYLSIITRGTVFLCNMFQNVCRSLNPRLLERYFKTALESSFSFKYNDWYDLHLSVTSSQWFCVTDVSKHQSNSCEIADMAPVTQNSRANYLYCFVCFANRTAGNFSISPLCGNWCKFLLQCQHCIQSYGAFIYFCALFTSMESSNTTLPYMQEKCRS